MVFLFYLLVRVLGGVLHAGRSDGGSKDLEILVLRQTLLRWHRELIRRNGGQQRAGILTATRE
jgi:hypothetical protein